MELYSSERILTIYLAVLAKHEIVTNGKTLKNILQQHIKPGA